MEELMLMTITKLKDAIKNVTQNEHSNNIINIKNKNETYCLFP